MKGNMKIKYATDAIPVGAKTKDDGYFPTIALGNDAAQIVKGKKVGEKCEIKLKGIIKSMSEDEREGMRVVFEAHDMETEEGYDEVDDEIAERALKVMKKVKGSKK